MKKELSRFLLVLDLIKKEGIEIIWTNQKSQVTMASYVVDINAIILPRKLWKSGSAHPINIDAATFLLFHELGHYLNARMKGTTSYTIEDSMDLKEELWCDSFAVDMCKKLGMKDPIVYAGYLNGDVT